MPKILLVSGSLKTTSSNSNILKALALLAGENLACEIFDGIGDLPHFSPDIDVEPFPLSVSRWREAIASAEAVVICTPEYAFGVPGSLKNALDWIVSSGELVGKPVILISASPSFLGGDKARASLLLTMTALGSNIAPDRNLVIPVILKKIDAQGKITEDGLRVQLQSALRALATAIHETAGRSQEHGR